VIEAAQATESMSDQELIARYRDGVDNALEILIQRHTQLVRRCSRRFFLHDGAFDDLVQVGMIGLLEAVRSYRPDRGATFRTFASLCASRRIMGAVEQSIRRSRPIPAGRGASSLPPDGPHDVWATDGDLELPIQLSGLEEEVLRGVGEGEQPADVAARLRRPPRSIYNAMSRIRQKLKTLISPPRI
jgi:RNA polymerase sporulation-specific sigma factor